jgi:hypothetical protein
MGRAYAGILGPLAFVAVLMRGFRHNGAAESILLSAWLGLVAMALLGLVAGRLADWIVEESVRSRMVAELAAREEARQTSARKAES